MRAKLLIAAALTTIGASAQAQSLNTYGGIGLIDMPTAHSMPDGHVAFSFGSVGNSGRTSVSFQLAPRVEGSIRYSVIDGFGPSAQNRGDQQFDLKFSLLNEETAPFSLALGLRDIIGSAVYSSEYLVASKEIRPGVRLTGGLGWGRLAGERFIGNPIGGTRPNAAGGTEQFNSSNFFNGDDIGLFGGVEWQPGGSSWRFKAEYSSDTYDQETASGAFTRSTGWNFGIERDLGGGFDAGLYAVAGEEIGFRISFAADPMVPRVPPDLINGPPPFTARPADGKRGTNWTKNEALKAQLLTALEPAFKAEGLRLRAASLKGEVAEVDIENLRHDRPAKAIGRAARLLAAGSPPSVETFRINTLENGLPTASVSLSRTDLENLVDRHEAVPESWDRFEISDGRHVSAPDLVAQEDGFSYSIGPQLPFSLFGDSFDFDLLIDAQASYRLNRGLSISGELSQSVLGRFQDVTPPSGPLPRVRSNFAAYQSGGPTLERLTVDYTTKLAPGLYGRASVGYLERMFGGVSGELLWKDVSSPLAYGVELNYVKLREPDSVVGLDSYDTLTGHGSLYWDTGWHGVFAQLDAGRYLAGDWGATLTVSRRFENGWEVAGYFTDTNADTSGSTTGNFDKGVRLTIPLGWTAPFPTRRTLEVPFSDLARDDGARLDVSNRLYPLVRAVDHNRLAENWAAFWQ